MNKFIFVIFIFIGISIVFSQPQVKKPIKNYTGCYECGNLTNTYIRYSGEPNEAKKLKYIYSLGCYPVRTVSFCGYHGQLIIGPVVR